MLKGQKKNDSLKSNPNPKQNCKSANKQSLKVQKVIPIQSTNLGEASSNPPQAQTLAHESKQSQMIVLLKRSEGATIEELISAIGWQAHSIRGAMSGLLKKRLGLVIVSEVKEGIRVYRIMGSVSRS